MLNLTEERQLQRLKYIDLCAYVLGFVNRKFLMNRFEIKEAWATKDFNVYRQKTGGNLIYSHALKAYAPVDWFTPYFEHDINDVIDLLCEGKQCVVCEPQFVTNIYGSFLNKLNPNLNNVNQLFRALALNKKVEISYISRSSGEITRLIVPHSLIKTGSFIYVRAFDHHSGEFRSFKLKRIISSTFVDSIPSKKQLKAADKDWNTEVVVDIEVNGSTHNSKAIEFDYELVNGKLSVKIRKALLFYFLMDYNIAPLEYSNLPDILFPLKVVSINEP